MNAPWWKGARGEWYVIAQFALFFLLVLGPRTLPGLPAVTWPAASRTVGVALMLAGVALVLAAALRLGRSLTPLPYPREGAQLAQTGPYAIVRHPIYSGALLAVFGWAAFVRGPLTLLEALAVLVLLDIKSRREERWLAERFEGYAGYQKRVRKLVPFLY